MNNLTQEGSYHKNSAEVDRLSENTSTLHDADDLIQTESKCHSVADNTLTSQVN